MANYKDIPRFTPMPTYKITQSWNYMQDWLDQHADIMDMNPVFQRGHVWDETKQRRYIEYILRGGASGRDIYWNQKGWMNGFDGVLYLVDGKQRIEAVQRFMRDELTIFEGIRHSDYGNQIMPLDASFNWYVNTLKTYEEVVQWYLDLNTGGVVHTDEEIERVRKHLEDIKKGAIQ